MYGCGGLKGVSTPTPEEFRWGGILMTEISENAGLPASTGGLNSKAEKEKKKKQCNNVYCFHRKSSTPLSLKIKILCVYKTKKCVWNKQ